MFDKLIGMVVCWVSVVVAYLILAFTMPMHREIVSQTLVSLNSSGNMSNFPGTYEAVGAFPYYVWFIPGIVGLVWSVIWLKSDAVREYVKGKLR